MEDIALYLVDGMWSGSVGLADLGHADGDAQAAEERIGSVTATATVIEKFVTFPYSASHIRWSERV